MVTSGVHTKNKIKETKRVAEIIDAISSKFKEKIIQNKSIVSKCVEKY